jgi:hypothetical protein
MRVTTAFWRLLRLEGIWVRAVAFEADRVVVRVVLRRRRLVCPLCAYCTAASEGVQDHDSVWRHLDLGAWRLEVRARLRQLRCPDHGVHVEAVAFARHRAGLTRDLDDLVAWLATKADKTTISRMLRIDWQTVGRVVERVCDEQLDTERLNDLFDIGIDEIAWRKGHRYLTLVTDHRRGKIVWGAEGRSAKVADRFFAELDPPEPEPVSGCEPGPDEAQQDRSRIGPRAAKLEAISLDMGPGYALNARRHAPQANICISLVRRPSAADARHRCGTSRACTAIPRLRSSSERVYGPHSAAISQLYPRSSSANASVVTARSAPPTPRLSVIIRTFRWSLLSEAVEARTRLGYRLRRSPMVRGSCLRWTYPDTPRISCDEPDRCVPSTGRQRKPSMPGCATRDRNTRRSSVICRVGGT